MSDITTVERIIPASPEAIFALISDPSRHSEIDGSGTVREAKDAPRQLTLGSTFGMDMKMAIPYSMVNTVVEFEPNRLIAWKPASSIAIISKVLGGPIWRYELEPVDGGTRVRESWDLSEDRIKFVLKPLLRKKTIAGMTDTLKRIEQILTKP
jgi:uncharacterized protein YndB with AHSA1/START domain